MPITVTFVAVSVTKLFMHVHVLKYNARADLLLPGIMGGQYKNWSNRDNLKHVELWVATWLSHFSACHTSLKIIEWLHNHYAVVSPCNLERQLTDWTGSLLFLLLVFCAWNTNNSYYEKLNKSNNLWRSHMPQKCETSLDWTPSMRFASSQLSSCVTRFSLQLILSKIGQQYWKPSNPALLGECEPALASYCVGKELVLVLVKVFSIAVLSC